MPKAQFSKHALDYDKYARIQRDNALRLTELALLQFPSPKKIADVGCGTGGVGSHLSKRIASQTSLECCDISSEMLKIAQEKIEHQNCVFTEASLPAGYGYDLIFSNFAFQWYEELEETIAVLLDRLAPNGILALSFPIKGTFPELADAINATQSHSLLFPFYEEAFVEAICKKCHSLFREVSEVEDIFPDTLNFLRELHLTGATAKGQHLSAGKLRKLLKVHDSYFDGKVRAKYKIFTALLKKGPQ